MKGSALSCSGYVKRLCRSTRASSGWASQRTCRAESDKEIALRVGADEGSADL